MAQRTLTAVLVFLLAACQGQPAPQSEAPDVGAAADVVDEPSPDAVEMPDVPEVVPEPPPERVRATLSEGEQVEGELVATYDASAWWGLVAEPVEAQYYAIFDPAAFDHYPNDRSMRFVSSEDLVSLETLPPQEVESFRDLLRRQHIVFGRSPLTQPAYVLTANESYHLEEDGYGDFAWDLVFTSESGDARYEGDGTQGEDYLIWDAEVVLPTRGVVVEVVDDAPDNPPGTYPEGAINNLVGIHVGGSFYLYLLHLRQGSVPEHIQVGLELAEGTLVGRVGNSGVTLEPHLHVVLLWYDESSDPPRSWSVPVEFEGLHSAPSPTGSASNPRFSAPPSGVWISSEAF